jgi:circadian clock protein KaiC
LDFVFRGAQRGEKGILFSFEETPERLRAAARAFGWDLDAEMAKGMVEIVFIPQPDIMVEAGLVMMEARIKALGAQRVAIDSVSVFLHKLRDAQVVREKVFQLASIVQNAEAVGFFATDIPYGTSDISRFGVEETVVDGIILLTSTSEGLERQRYLEIYKLRRTAHLKGRHSMVISKDGVEVFPRYSEEVAPSRPPVPLGRDRLTSGVPGLDALVGGGLLSRSMTLVSGGAGVGKTALGLQFIADGAARQAPGLYVSLEDGPDQIAQIAESFGLPWAQGEADGLIRSSYLSPEDVRTSQFFSILGDQIRAQKTRRLVLDGVGYLANGKMAPDELREMLLVLVSQFKLLGVTALLLLDTDALYATGTVPPNSFVSVADNLLLLRYELAGGEHRPYLMVVKTRESAHDRGSHAYTLDRHGMRVDRPASADT